MQFCLEIWGTDYEKIKETCILAEKLGYYGFYYGESLAEIDLDCWSIISNLSAITTRIKLGPVITYLIPQYRNIALLAKQATTLQEMSKGRLEFRTGAIMQFCLEIWGTDYEKIKETCILAEKLGYYGFYYGESLAEIDLDCWSIISNLSSDNFSDKAWLVITYLIPQYRNIALLAKQATTLQEMSKGRLEFRTGAGRVN